jgi:hypothetical protein
LFTTLKIKNEKAEVQPEFLDYGGTILYKVQKKDGYKPAQSGIILKEQIS